jgi:hypothetical protein
MGQLRGLRIQCIAFARETHEAGQVQRQFAQRADGVFGFAGNDMQMNVRHQLIGSLTIVQQEVAIVVSGKRVLSPKPGRSGAITR